MFALIAGVSVAAHAQSSGGPGAGSYNGFRVDGALVPVDAIERGGPPRDGIPAIDQPKFLPADKAMLRSTDRVLGLLHKGVARAYPVRILNWHEVVNDRLAGEPIAVTYCPLCGTGMAFDARLASVAGPRDLIFGVSGLLYNSDVLLYDRGTESLWSQLKQTALTGPLKGSRLVALPLEHTTWQDWRARHPNTSVLSNDTGFARDYDRDPYTGYEAVAQLMFRVQHEDKRFPVKEWVLGVEVNGVSKAYPFSALARNAGAAGVVTDSVGGRDIRILFDARNRTARAQDGQGKSLPGIMAFWFAWVAFHPRTEIYQ